MLHQLQFLQFLSQIHATCSTPSIMGISKMSVSSLHSIKSALTDSNWSASLFHSVSLILVHAKCIWLAVTLGIWSGPLLQLNLGLSTPSHPISLLLLPEEEKHYNMVCLVMFKSNSDGVSSFSMGWNALTWDIEFAFTLVAVHSHCITMFNILLPAQVALLLLILILTTPVSDFIPCYKRFILFDSVVWFSFYFHISEVLLSEVVACCLPNILYSHLDMLFICYQGIHRYGVVSMEKDMFCGVKHFL